MKKSGFFLLFLTLQFLNQAQEQHIITSDSVKLFVNVKGSGTPCLYLHGGPGSGSYWMEKVFSEQLEQRFQMVYLDQRGVGRSASPLNGDYSMNRMATDFEEIRRALGIEKWLTLGHSFGGLLQMGYFEKYPENVLGMLMINCSLDMEESYTKSWCPKACEFLNLSNTEPFLNNSEPIYTRWENLITLLNEKDLMWKVMFSQPEYMNQINETYADFPAWNGDFGSIAMTMDDYWQNFKPKTINVKVPVLFFYGKTDWAVGPNHYKEVEFPKMMIWESQGGHMPFLDNKNELIKAIVAFCKTNKF
jgi:proline iminopeptidase